MRAALLLAIACSRAAVVQVDDPTPDQVCAVGAGASACAPDAVCVQTRGGQDVCVCCTLDGDAVAVAVFDADAGPQACAATLKHWHEVCP